LPNAPGPRCANKGAPWTKVIDSDANAPTFNLGVTYAMSQHTTLVTMLAST